MQQASCGLDFGTSNSTFGFIGPDQTPILAPLEGGSPIIPSAMFYNFEDDEIYFGRAGVSEYVTGADGRLLRALKSVLGTSLMNDETRIKARRVPFTEIIATFVAALHKHAEEGAGRSFSHVVAGRPVHFVDDDTTADKAAENQLASALKSVGFSAVEFQYEPIAAALDYEQKITNEQLALVVDIGGGTSDFTLVRLSPDRAKNIARHDDILATGGVHVGGTDFDRLLSMAEIMSLLGLGSTTKDGKRNLPVAPYYDLATWHRINRLYTRSMMAELRSTRQEAKEQAKVETLINLVEGRHGHLLAGHVETAKIELSAAPTTMLKFAEGAIRLETCLSADRFESAIETTASRIFTTVGDILKQASLSPNDIETLIMTGGTTQMPLIRRWLDTMFPTARIVQNDAFGSVGCGLALDAARRFK